MSIVRERILVGGELREGGGQLDRITFPYSGEVIAEIARADAADLDAAIDAALQAFESMRDVPAHVRAELLHRVSAAIRDEHEELEALLVLETGKPVGEARIEVERAAVTMRLSAEEATRIDGEIVPLETVSAGAGRLGEVRYFPLGVVVAITPFNSPLNLVAHKVGPALAAGNAVIVKPAERTPLSALRIGSLVAGAARSLGLTGQIVSVVHGGPEVAMSLVADMRVAAVTFTGSATVGWGLRCHAGHKRVILELGGNGAVIVHGDADIAWAAERCAAGGFLLAGQVCASVQRVYVARPAFPEFIRRFLGEVAKLEVNDPRLPTTTVGPMIDEAAARRVVDWVEQARSSGATVLCGGAREGALVAPIVVTGTSPDMRLVCDEVFGPVVVVEAYDSLEEAITAANATQFGLQAGVFTRDLSVALQTYRKLKVGGVVVNDINGWRIDSMPYGGVGASGDGREGPRAAIRQLMDARLLVVNHSVLSR